MKLTKRKGFNFFRSYYDVYNELSDSDKVAFMDALLDRQFLGVKPEDLKGMAKFAYISQTNSIDSQVRGYEDKTKTKLNTTPTAPPTYGGLSTPTEQVEEKEKGKEKEEDEGKEENIYDFEVLDISEFKDVRELQKYYLNNLRLMNALISEPLNKIKFKEIPDRLETYTSELESSGRFKETFKEYSAYFKNWIRTRPAKGKATKDDQGRLVANFSNPVI